MGVGLGFTYFCGPGKPYSLKGKWRVRHPCEDGERVHKGWAANVLPHEVLLDLTRAHSTRARAEETGQLGIG